MTFQESEKSRLVSFALLLLVSASCSDTQRAEIPSRGGAAGAFGGEAGSSEGGGAGDGGQAGGDGGQAGDAGVAGESGRGGVAGEGGAAGEGGIAGEGGALSGPRLGALGVSEGTLDPPFADDVRDYSVRLGLSAASLIVTPTGAEPSATIRVNGEIVPSGEPSSPIELSIGETEILVSTSESGQETTYLLNVDRASTLLRQSYIKAFNTGEEDRFGASVALFGDTLVVGAPGEASAATSLEPEAERDQQNNDAPYSGAAYVYTRAGSLWSPRNYLKASNTAIGDSFGERVAIFGDTIAVGAPSQAAGDDETATASGAVYVYTRAGSTWNEQANLKVMAGERLAGLGTSLALSENTLATGMYDGETVFVFERTGDSWGDPVPLSASNSQPGDGFGSSLALHGDTLAVGSLYGDAVYVFVKTQDVWEEQAALDVSAVSVALHSDTLVTGGSSEDGSAGGAVYLYERSNGIWERTHYILASNTHAGAGFGEMVALTADTLAVGAPWDASDASGVDGDPEPRLETGSGAVFLLSRSGASWAHRAFVKASNPEEYDTFGSALALSDTTLAVGAQYEDSSSTGVDGEQQNEGTTYAGAVYVRGLTPGP